MDNCQECGERLTAGARFCATCGAVAANDSEETRFASEQTRVVAPDARPRAVEPLATRAPARAPERRAPTDDEPERVIFKVRPTLLFVKVGYVLAALSGLLLIALLTWQPWVEVSFYVSLPLALALLLIPAYKHLMRNTVQYTLTDSKIEMDEGFISRTTRNIPLDKVQDVTVTSTVFQRLLRFGSIVLDNAGAEGGTTVLRDIPDPRRHADLLLRELRRWR